MSIKIPHPVQQQPLGGFGEAFHVPLHFQDYGLAWLLYFAFFPAEKPKNPNNQGGVWGQSVF